MQFSDVNLNLTVVKAIKRSSIKQIQFFVLHSVLIKSIVANILAYNAGYSDRFLNVATP